MANFTYSSTGLELTRRFEGLRLTAYQDSCGIWTIGYGHTGSHVRQGLTITEPQALELLTTDIARAVDCVNRSVHAPINQNQFDALVDFVFNLGSGNFLGSTLLRRVNEGDFTAAKDEFLRWNHAGNQILEGLTRRRQAEADLFAA
jgi:lysozyme